MPRVGRSLEKAVAGTGACSRREALRLIVAGRVRLNGQPCTRPAQRVCLPDDRVSVDGGAPISDPSPLETPRLWRHHKPAGLITTHSDPQRRPSLFDRLPPSLPRLVSVGRLDIATEGLILLTGSGRLARLLELPSSGLVREYSAEVSTGARRVAEDMLREMREGLVLGDGTRLRAVEVDVTDSRRTRCWVRMRLREGKKREVRRIWEHFGFSVCRLVRLSYGPFVLGDLAAGEVQEVPVEQVRQVREACETPAAGAACGR